MAPMYRGVINPSRTGSHIRHMCNIAVLLNPGNGVPEAKTSIEGEFTHP